jgi:hypothetical protein
MRLFALPCLFSVALAAVIGCASTTVRKNPGPHDRGVRYYLPKPYLFVSTAVVKDGDKVTPQHGKVSISLEMRPDFSEEYSVHVRAGVGKNNTTLTLDDGWKLKAVDMTIDSNFSSNVEAVSGLLDVVKGLQPTGAKSEDSDRQLLASSVTAHNVPLGYYESVIGCDPNGKKQIYGWRYVGFVPFSNCPVDIHGTQGQSCTDGEMYGLVTENNIMVFKKLDALKGEPVAAPK